jgi:hypothetical protein
MMLSGAKSDFLWQANNCFSVKCGTKFLQPMVVFFFATIGPQNENNSCQKKS